MPDVGVGGRAVWVGIEVGGGEVDEGGGGGFVEVGGRTGVLLAVASCEVAGGVVGVDVHRIVGDGVAVQVAPAVPIVVVVGVGLAEGVPGFIEPWGVADTVTVSVSCDAIVVDSAGWKGVGDGASEALLSEGRIRPKL